MFTKNHCLCCLDAQNLSPFKESDRQLYKEFVGYEVSDGIKPEICVNCRNKLISSLEFLKLCRKSYDSLLEVVSVEEFIEQNDTLLSVEEFIVRDQEDDDRTQIIQVLHIEKAPEGEDSEGVQHKSGKISTQTEKPKKEKRFVCDICNTKFAHSNSLKCHMRIHTKQRPFTCEICGKSFSQKTILKTHIAAKHDKESCVKCDLCPKVFPRSSFLNLHKRLYHDKLRDYKCTKCDKTYKQQSHLVRHVESAHMNVRHSCNICQKTFTKSWSLKMHQFKHTDTANFPYKCSHCPMTFQRRDNWLKHVSKQHPGVEIKKDPVEINLPI